MSFGKPCANATHGSKAAKRKASVEELLAIADRAAAHAKQPYANHAELLYDEHGLPK